jgi:hypothetical protein
MTDHPIRLFLCSRSSLLYCWSLFCLLLNFQSLFCLLLNFQQGSVSCLRVCKIFKTGQNTIGQKYAIRIYNLNLVFKSPTWSVHPMHTYFSYGSIHITWTSIVLFLSYINKQLIQMTLLKRNISKGVARGLIILNLWFYLIYILCLW